MAKDLGDVAFPTRRDDPLHIPSTYGEESAVARGEGPFVEDRPSTGAPDVTSTGRNPAVASSDLHVVIPPSSRRARVCPGLGRRSPAPAGQRARSGRWRVILVAAAAVTLAACGGDEASTLSPAAAEGRTIAREAGCVACHGADGGGQVGPAWKGLAGSVVSLSDGTTVTADTEYLIRAITDPDAEMVAGYTIRMPENTLSEDEVASVVAYIEELR